jgi:hypothetical chaperone protein
VSKPLGCAIDFGTTNSSVALVYPEEVRVLDVGGHIDNRTVRSLLYLHRNGNRAVGAEALRQFLLTSRATTNGESDSRLFAGLKYQLAESISSTWSWGCEFKAADLVGYILKYLKQKAEEEAGGVTLDRLSLGHPVVFAGSGRDQGAHQLGLQTLRSAATAAGFKHVTLIPEPVAALSALGETTNGIAFTVDFGGGTCDLAVMSIGERARTIATSGITIGGEHFDGRLFELKLDTHFGLDATCRGRDGSNLPIPARVRTSLHQLWTALRLLLDQHTASVLREFESLQGGGTLSQLLEILYGGHTYNFYSAIEEAKVGLSMAESSTIYFSRAPLGISVSVDVSRAEFDNLISSDLECISERVWDVLATAELSPEQVDVVLLTGGSSKIPAFVARLTEIFDRNKFIERPEFTTVVYGLGKYAQQKWTS